MLENYHYRYVLTLSLLYPESFRNHVNIDQNCFRVFTLKVKESLLNQGRFDDGGWVLKPKSHHLFA